tara:strand:- start:287 stop:481 length:195 start_codon:yes stop_codon:yes gene_type:complete
MPIITNFGCRRFVGSKEEFRKEIQDLKILEKQYPNIPPDHLKELDKKKLNSLFELHKPRFFKGE